MAFSAIAPFWFVVSMLSKLATASAGPRPVWTPCGATGSPARSNDVDAHRTRRDCTAFTRHRDRFTARLFIEGPVPRRHRAVARRPQPRRHAGEHRLHHLPARVDEDDPAADLLHE